MSFAGSNFVAGDISGALGRVRFGVEIPARFSVTADGFEHAQ